MATIISEFHRGANARRKQGESYFESLWILTFGILVAMAVTLCMSAWCSSLSALAGAGFNKDVQQEMSPGDSLSSTNTRLRWSRSRIPTILTIARPLGLMTIYNRGQLVDTILPETRFYKTSEQPTTEVALRSTLKEDLYVVFSGMNQNSKTVFRAYLFPLVAWIWIGGVVFVLGTLICLIPSKQGQQK